MNLSKDALKQYTTLNKAARQKFQKAGSMEKEYLRKLRQVVRQIDSIVKGLAPKGVVDNLSELTASLRRYSELLRPWAKSVAAKMLAEVSQREKAAWVNMAKMQGKALRKELELEPTGDIFRRILEEQVGYITSLPLDAAERVHTLTTEALMDSSRASTVAAEIMRTNEVTLSRAKLIARTEVARTASVLTQARSEHIGATHYIWRTAGDPDVRDSHRKMNGKVIAWAETPEVDPGKFYHAGQFPNCRCYAIPLIPEPIIPEEE